MADIFIDSEKSVEKKHNVTFVIRGSEYAVKARKYGVELALRLGDPDNQRNMIVAAICELCWHIIDHEGRRKISIALVETKDEQGILIEVRDKGEVLDDPKTLKLGGRESDQSLGLGLEGMQRFMDDFEIFTDPVKGTAVMMSKWTEHAAHGSE